MIPSGSRPRTGVLNEISTPLFPFVANVRPRSVIASRAGPAVFQNAYGPVIAMSGLRAVKALGREATVGGFDITPELIDAIEAGDVAFTVDQQQYLQGYIPVLLLFLNITNQNTLGGGLPILTGPGFVTPDNAAAVKALVAAGTR